MSQEKAETSKIGSVNFAPEVETRTEEDDKKVKYELVPPDGGWGWLVLCGSCLVNLLIPGTIKSFGILFVEFIEVFHATQIEASWIPALCYFLYSSLGPLASYLSIKFSYRTVAILGGAFASSGMMLCYFATSITHLYITYGILVGIGAGLSFPPGIFIVTSYFRRYRGFANGIAISGSAIGSMILPPFLGYLLENYGVDGAMLIMGAITLNVWVGAGLYHPVQWHMKKVPLKEESIPMTKIENAPPVVETSYRSNQNEMDGRILSFSDSEITVASPAAAASKSHHLPTKHLDIMHMDHSTLSKRSSYVSTSSLRYVSTAFHGSTLVGLHPEYTSQATIKSIKQSWSFASCCREKINQQSELAQLLMDPRFAIILASNAAISIGYTNFTILLPSYALELHYDKSVASYFLSIVAAFDLIGRIGSSTISDLLPIPKRYYYVTSLVISGTCLVALPFVDSYALTCAVCGIFGLSSGTYIALTAVTMVELLGEQRLVSSYAISLFVNGILQLVSPPICGLVYQNTRSYVEIIVGLGLVLISGAGIWSFLPYANKSTPQPGINLS